MIFSERNYNSKKKFLISTWIISLINVPVPGRGSTLTNEWIISIFTIFTQCKVTKLGSGKMYNIIYPKKYVKRSSIVLKNSSGIFYKFKLSLKKDKLILLFAKEMGFHQAQSANLNKNLFLSKILLWIFQYNVVFNETSCSFCFPYSYLNLNRVGKIIAWNLLWQNWLNLVKMK